MPGEAPFRSLPARVIVAGGGIAALELVVALHKLAGERVAIELIAPGEHFVYRPLLVAEPFGVGNLPRFPLSQILNDQGASQRRGRLAEVRAQEHEVSIDSGEQIAYDALVVAAGARTVEAVAGALTFDGPESVTLMRTLVERAATGELGSIAFALAASAASWSLPLYELALMTAIRAPGAHITIATAEDAPLQLFGQAVSRSMAERLARAGVELLTGVAPVEYEDAALALADGRRVNADAAVALPALAGPAIPGLPHDPRGFVPVDEHGRVEGTADVYAAGDVTAFELKQGGVSVRQAQAVAECIAARIGAPVVPQPFEPFLRGMLLTGAAPSYMQWRGGESEQADSPLWWPPTKIADSYLVPYLVSRFQLSVLAAPGPGEADLISSAPAGGEVPARPRRPGA
ncbi:MAG TPA: FAD-dependent oxidoreductase [Thermoleophilaceae bacterium]|nr:FAD-dependent oxidoreductase [Thermoleophilaceae bacterium]